MTFRKLTMWLPAVVLLGSGASLARADEVKDDVRSDGHDVNRAAKKAGHRVNEAACTGSQAECGARKRKHRYQETRDKFDDKVGEQTDKVKESVN
jgi:hypothetical protein